jgi:hypothetical protein
VAATRPRKDSDLDDQGDHLPAVASTGYVSIRRQK